jgi:hypothetical protein
VQERKEGEECNGSKGAGESKGEARERQGIGNRETERQGRGKGDARERQEGGKREVRET